MFLLPVLNPIAALLFHLLHELISFIANHIALDDISGSLEVIHELHTGLSSILLCLKHLSDRVSHLILMSHRSAGHSEEVKFLLAQFLDLLAGKNSFDALLNKKACRIFLLLCGLFLDQALTNLLVELCLHLVLLE